tara:strand:- start:79667 stop:81373 length:1707 start_codon:yes stop_codon:yes gene_type:complete
MSILEKLTEGIIDRNLSAEGAAVRTKWEASGLLEGLKDREKDSMATLLENQAKELLREASSMAGGDVEGFAAVAFPIVRRVFGGLIANELVSVQPMSLPSGLIFFLDFTKTDDKLAGGLNDSIYGGGKTAKQIADGVSIDGTNAETGLYNLNQGYSAPTGSVATAALSTESGDGAVINGVTALNGLNDAMMKRLDHDPELVSGSLFTNVEELVLTSSTPSDLDQNNLMAAEIAVASGATLIRRLTRKLGTGDISFIVAKNGSLATSAGTAKTITYPSLDNLTTGGANGALVGSTPWGLEGTNTLGHAGTNDDIAEIDIKVDSIAVTAQTRKLKAKWTPELGQDLNAYHNLDAEVELTNVLSEHIGLEIDQEILGDLVKGAKAGTMHWSRRPGKFLNRSTGAPISTGANESMLGGDFTGTVSEWYETLLETVNDISANIHRKTLKGGANFLVCSPEAANVLEFTAGFKAKVEVDADKGSAGAVNVGSLSNKLEVYVDPYFPRNVILCGRKGSSFLESGYVYAPYVPLQVTPTIFGTEDFVPRKGVMTRYAKKMVRPDMYGLVVIQDFNG